MALPDYTTQDATTYKSNIDSTAADHDSRIVTLEGTNNPELNYVATTTGSSADIDLTVPTWVNEIVFSVNDQRMSTVGNFVIVLGTSATWDTTGYVSTLRVATTTGSLATSTSGFIYATGGSVGNAHTGHLHLTRLTTGSNTWIFTSQVSIDLQNRFYNGTGRKTLTSNLGRLRVTTSGVFSQGGLGYRYLP